MIQNWLQLTFSIIISLFSRFIPISLIVGTCGSFITFNQAVAPLVTLYGSFFGSLVLVILQFLIFKKITLLVFLRSLPSFIAGFSFRCSYNKYFICGLSFSFVFLFLIHQDIYGIDLFYSLFWIIAPMLLFCNNFFLKYLGALFLAHGAGTVIYLYTSAPLDHGMYAALIFQALIERISLTIIGSLVHYLLISIINKYVVSKKSRYTGLGMK